jgi:hypothetical protein
MKAAPLGDPPQRPPSPPASFLPPQVAYNWQQMQVAARENRLMLWRMPRHSDGAELFVVCGTTEECSDMKLQPLAMLFDGDPSEAIEGKSPLAGN